MPNRYAIVQSFTNEINAVISFGNSPLHATVLSEIHSAQTDDKLSARAFWEFSLALDLAEIFRTIFYLVNKRVMKP